MNEKDRLTLIKDILLTDDREFSEKISRRIHHIENILNQQNLLAQKVDPLIAEHINEFANNIPNTLSSTITKALKHEIKNSRDDVVDALYPILGKMIKKYIAQEMKVLSDKINERLSWKRRIKSKIKGDKQTSTNILFDTNITQVFLIDKTSGLLVANYSKTPTVDEEMISGMLTAIKLFAEDAFLKKEQSLELIEYDLFKIHLQSFVKHYVAIVISGPYTSNAKDKVENLIFDFYGDFMSVSKSNDEDGANTHLKLSKYFDNVFV